MYFPENKDSVSFDQSEHTLSGDIIKVNVMMWMKFNWNSYEAKRNG